MKPTTALVLLALATTGCPKPTPDPVPADDPCKKPGQACADPPAPSEGPPPVGTQVPPR